MANNITLLRIIFLPLLIWSLDSGSWGRSLLSLMLFILLALTDLLDGYVARNRNEVTSTGKLLDPVADKMLLMAALLPLIGRGLVPAWMGVVILGREFLVSALRMIAATTYRIVIAAGVWGKVKTVFYNVGIPFIIGSPLIPAWQEHLHLFGFWVLAAGILLSLASAVQYLRLLYPSSPPHPPPA
jgi:CDP-diacylglycerol--glycerol-3-phosphate 3-phosphatidyltransferase